MSSAEERERDPTSSQNEQKIKGQDILTGIIRQTFRRTEFGSNWPGVVRLSSVKGRVI